MKRLVLAVTLAATFLPTGASAQKTTNCEATVDIVVSPGLTAEGSSGTFTSNGETGTITCDGPVDGAEPTGAGTWGIAGNYGTEDPDSCTGGGEGDVVHSFTFPTADGSHHGENHATFTFGALSGGSTFGGEVQGDKLSGTFSVTPREGDCFSKPMTGMTVDFKLTAN